MLGIGAAAVPHIIIWSHNTAGQATSGYSDTVATIIGYTSAIVAALLLGIPEIGGAVLGGISTAGKAALVKVENWLIRIGLRKAAPAVEEVASLTAQYGIHAPKALDVIKRATAWSARKLGAKEEQILAWGLMIEKTASEFIEARIAQRVTAEGLERGTGLIDEAIAAKAAATDIVGTIARFENRAMAFTMNISTGALFFALADSFLYIVVVGCTSETFTVEGLAHAFAMGLVFGSFFGLGFGLLGWIQRGSGRIVAMHNAGQLAEMSWRQKAFLHSGMAHRFDNLAMIGKAGSAVVNAPLTGASRALTNTSRARFIGGLLWQEAAETTAQATIAHFLHIVYFVRGWLGKGVPWFEHHALSRSPLTQEVSLPVVGPMTVFSLVFMVGTNAGGLFDHARFEKQTRHAEVIEAFKAMNPEERAKVRHQVAERMAEREGVERDREGVEAERRQLEQEGIQVGDIRLQPTLEVMNLLNEAEAAIRRAGEGVSAADAVRGLAKQRGETAQEKTKAAETKTEAANRAEATREGMDSFADPAEAGRLAVQEAELRTDVRQLAEEVKTAEAEKSALEQLADSLEGREPADAGQVISDAREAHQANLDKQKALDARIAELNTKLSRLAEGQIEIAGIRTTVDRGLADALEREAAVESFDTLLSENSWDPSETVLCKLKAMIEAVRTEVKGLRERAKSHAEEAEAAQARADELRKAEKAADSPTDRNRYKYEALLFEETAEREQALADRLNGEAEAKEAEAEKPNSEIKGTGGIILTFRLSPARLYEALLQKYLEERAECEVFGTETESAEDMDMGNTHESAQEANRLREKANAYDETADRIEQGTMTDETQMMEVQMYRALAERTRAEAEEVGTIEIGEGENAIRVDIRRLEAEVNRVELDEAFDPESPTEVRSAAREALAEAEAEGRPTFRLNDREYSTVEGITAETNNVEMTWLQSTLYGTQENVRMVRASRLWERAMERNESHFNFFLPSVANMRALTEALTAPSQAGKDIIIVRTETDVRRIDRLVAMEIQARYVFESETTTQQIGHHVAELRSGMQEASAMSDNSKLIKARANVSRFIEGLVATLRERGVDADFANSMKRRVAKLIGEEPVRAFNESAGSRWAMFKAELRPVFAALFRGLTADSGTVAQMRSLGITKADVLRVAGELRGVDAGRRFIAALAILGMGEVYCARLVAARLNALAVAEALKADNSSSQVERTGLEDVGITVEMVNNMKAKVDAKLADRLADARHLPLIKAMDTAFARAIREGKRTDGAAEGWRNDLSALLSMDADRAGEVLALVAKKVFTRQLLAATRLGHVTTRLFGHSWHAERAGEYIRGVTGDLALLHDAFEMERSATEAGQKAKDAHKAGDTVKAESFENEARSYREGAMELKVEAGYRGSFLSALETMASPDTVRDFAMHVRMELRSRFRGHITRSVTGLLQGTKDVYITEAQLEAQGLSRGFFDLLGLTANEGIAYERVERIFAATPNAEGTRVEMQDSPYRISRKNLEKLARHIKGEARMLQIGHDVTTAKGFAGLLPHQIKTIGELMYQKYGITEGLTGGGKSSVMINVLALYFRETTGRKSILVFSDKSLLEQALSDSLEIWEKVTIRSGRLGRQKLVVRQYREGVPAEEARKSVEEADIIFITQQGLQSALLDTRLGDARAFDPFLLANIFLDEVDTAINAADLIKPAKGEYSVGEKFPHAVEQGVFAVKFLLDEFNGDLSRYGEAARNVLSEDPDTGVRLETEHRRFNDGALEKFLEYLQAKGVVHGKLPLKEAAQDARYRAYFTALNRLGQRLVAHCGIDYNYRDGIKAAGTTVPGDKFSGEARVDQHFSDLYQAMMWDFVTQIEANQEGTGRGLNKVRLIDIERSGESRFEAGEIKVDPTSVRCSLAEVFRWMKEVAEREGEDIVALGFSGNAMELANVMEMLFEFSNPFGRLGGEFRVADQRNVLRLKDNEIQTSRSDAPEIMRNLRKGQATGNYILNLMTEIGSYDAEAAYHEVFRDTTRVVGDNQGEFWLYKANSMDRVRLRDCKKIFTDSEYTDVNVFIQKPSTRGLDVYTPAGVRLAVVVDKGLEGRSFGQALGRERGTYEESATGGGRINFERALKRCVVYADSERAAQAAINPAGRMTKAELVELAQRNRDAQMRLLNYTRVYEAASSMYSRVITEAIMAARREGRDDIAEQLMDIMLEHSKTDSEMAALFLGDNAMYSHEVIRQAVEHSFEIEAQVMRIVEQGRLEAEDGSSSMSWFAAVPGRPAQGKRGAQRGLREIFEDACGSRDEGTLYRRPQLWKRGQRPARGEKVPASLDRVRNTRELVLYLNANFEAARLNDYFPEYAGRSQLPLQRVSAKTPKTLGDARTSVNLAEDLAVRTGAREADAETATRTDLQMLERDLINSGMLEARQEGSEGSRVDLVRAYVACMRRDPENNTGLITRVVEAMTAFEAFQTELINHGFVDVTDSDDPQTWALRDSGRRLVTSYIKWTHMKTPEKLRRTKLIHRTASMEGMGQVAAAAGIIVGLGLADDDEDIAPLDDKAFVGALFALVDEQVVDVYTGRRSFENIMDALASMEAVEVITGQPLDAASRTDLMQWLAAPNASLAVEQFAERSGVLANPAVEPEARNYLSGSMKVNEEREKFEDASQEASRMRGHLNSAADDEDREAMLAKIHAAEQKMQEARDAIVNEARGAGLTFDAVEEMAVQIAGAQDALITDKPDDSVTGEDKQKADRERQNDLMPYRLQAARLFYPGMSESYLKYIDRTHRRMESMIGRDIFPVVDSAKEQMHASLLERLDSIISNGPDAAGRLIAGHLMEEAQKAINTAVAGRGDGIAQLLTQEELYGLVSGLEEVKNQAGDSVKAKLRKAGAFGNTEAELDDVLKGLAGQIKLALAEFEGSKSMKKLTAEVLTAIDGHESKGEVKARLEEITNVAASDKIDEDNMLDKDDLDRDMAMRRVQQVVQWMLKPSSVEEEKETLFKQESFEELKLELVDGEDNRTKLADVAEQAINSIKETSKYKVLAAEIGEAELDEGLRQTITAALTECAEYDGQSRELPGGSGDTQPQRRTRRLSLKIEDFLNWYELDEMQMANPAQMEVEKSTDTEVIGTVSLYLGAILKFAKGFAGSETEQMKAMARLKSFLLHEVPGHGSLDGFDVLSIDNTLKKAYEAKTAGDEEKAWEIASELPDFLEPWRVMTEEYDNVHNEMRELAAHYALFNDAMFNGGIEAFMFNMAAQLDFYLDDWEGYDMSGTFDQIGKAIAKLTDGGLLDENTPSVAELVSALREGGTAAQEVCQAAEDRMQRAQEQKEQESVDTKKKGSRDLVNKLIGIYEGGDHSLRSDEANSLLARMVIEQQFTGVNEGEQQFADLNQARRHVLERAALMLQHKARQERFDVAYDAARAIEKDKESKGEDEEEEQDDDKKKADQSARADKILELAKARLDAVRDDLPEWLLKSADEQLEAAANETDPDKRAGMALSALPGELAVMRHNSIIRDGFKVALEDKLSKVDILDEAQTTPIIEAHKAEFRGYYAANMPVVEDSRRPVRIASKKATIEALDELAEAAMLGAFNKAQMEAFKKFADTGKGLSQQLIAGEDGSAVLDQMRAGADKVRALTETIKARRGETPEGQMDISEMILPGLEKQLAQAESTIKLVQSIEGESLDELIDDAFVEASVQQGSPVERPQLSDIDGAEALRHLALAMSQCEIPEGGAFGLALIGQGREADAFIPTVDDKPVGVVLRVMKEEASDLPEQAHEEFGDVMPEPIHVGDGYLVTEYWDTLEFQWLKALAEAYEPVIRKHMGADNSLPDTSENDAFNAEIAGAMSEATTAFIDRAEAAYQATLDRTEAAGEVQGLHRDKLAADAKSRILDNTYVEVNGKKAELKIGDVGSPGKGADVLDADGFRGALVNEIGFDRNGIMTMAMKTAMNKVASAQQEPPAVAEAAGSVTDAVEKASAADAQTDARSARTLAIGL